MRLTNIYSPFAFLVTLLFLISVSTVNASQLDIVGPAGSGTFGGTNIVALPNGNIVVVDVAFDAPGPITDVGAVYLYNGKTGALISTITGSTASDGIGNSTITVLTNGNFVFRSSNWDSTSPAAVNAGALTFCSGTTGCSGVVSAANSIVGTTGSDNPGAGGVTTLTNGNYVARTPSWDSTAPVVTNVGAVTFCSGTTGCAGAISSSNSLIGSTSGDAIGTGAVTVLPNNNFVVTNTSWDAPGPVANVGAVAFCSGTTGCTGAVSAANSLVGSTASDAVGTVTVLTNGNYIVGTSGWDNGVVDVGAMTFCSGTTGCTGAVSAANSRIGVTAGDGTGSAVPSLLTNGNYVFRLQSWDNGAATDAGATSFCDGTTGCTGAVTAANSLVGTTTGDGTVIVVNPLTNGKYIVTTSSWDNGATANVGAVTLCNGTSGCTGAISTANSLYGSTTGDQVSSGGSNALTNGNYVVRSTAWNNAGITTAGAVTWCSGATGCTGPVTAANSLVGTTTSDGIGQYVTVLTNGNFVVRSNNWDPVGGPVWNVGATTWCDGINGTTVGPVTAANSLVGSTAGDTTVAIAPTALPNGNYIVNSSTWDNGAIVDAGASTLGNGLGGTVGPISAANSLVGTSTGDGISAQSVVVVGGSNYVVRSTSWDNGAIAGVGAVTWCNGTTGCTGPVTTSNSFIGATASDGIGVVTALSNGNYIIVATNADNGAITDAGSITWGDGANGTFGTVSIANSLMGATASDQVPSASSVAQANGNFLGKSTNYDNGAITQAGAFTYVAGNAPVVGVLTAENSVLGTVASGATGMVATIDTFNESLVVGRPGSNTVTILSPTYTASANGNWSAASTWNYGGMAAMHDVYIPNGRTVNLDVIANVTSVRFDCTAAVTGASATAYLIGSIRKDYCATGSFSYPAGTANGYSPVDSSITALGVNPSSLTIGATQSIHPSLSVTNSLKRFWTLTEAGDLTTDLVFNYLDPTDITSGESTFKLYRISAGSPAPVAPFTLNAAANTMSVSGISNFSDWAIGNLSPSAANTSVGGHITTVKGQGIVNAIVTMTDSRGTTRTTRTGSLGYYSFDSVSAGETYLVRVVSKRFTFSNPSRVVMVNDSVVDLDFVAEP